jgi:hypothetical protein
MISAAIFVGSIFIFIALDNINDTLEEIKKNAKK